MARIIPVLLLVLFFSTLLAQPQGKREKNRPSRGPRIYFPVTTQDAGNIPEGPERRFVFRFQNRGDAPLVIINVTTGCGCFTPDWSKDPVMPGKWGTIYGIYHTQGRPGPFIKSLDVRSNDTVSEELHKGYANPYFHLSVKGVVVPDTSRK